MMLREEEFLRQINRNLAEINRKLDILMAKDAKKYPEFPVDNLTEDSENSRLPLDLFD